MKNSRKDLDLGLVWQTFLIHLYQLSSFQPYYFLSLDQELKFCIKIRMRSNLSRVLLAANLLKQLKLIQMLSTKILLKTLTKSLKSDSLSLTFKIKNLVLNPFQLLLRVLLILFQMPLIKNLKSPKFFFKKVFMLVPAKNNSLTKEQSWK